MAVKDTEKKKAGAEKTSDQTKRPLLLIIIVGIAFVLAAVVGAYFLLFSEPTEEELAAQIAHDQKVSGKERGPQVGIMMDLDPFIINLAHPKARRFLKASITLELVNEKAKQDAVTLLPRIRNDTIMLLTSQTMEDIITMEGKIRLRDQIMARLTRILGPDRIKNIYFAQFVVQ